MAKRVMSKYDYVFDETCYRKISEESCTVPNMCLSMAEIYRKYVVTGGDISQLPGKVMPHTFDDGDEFDESFESEEYVDTMLHVQELRTRQPEPAYPAAEDKPDNEQSEASADEQSSSSKPQDPATKPSTSTDE